MGTYVAQKLIKLLIARDIPVKRARVGVLGLTFKENVPDLRNSRVPDILAELRQFGIEPRVADPRADAEEAHHEYGISLTPLEELTGLDAVVFAVSHDEYRGLGGDKLRTLVHDRGVVIDVKSMLDPRAVPPGLAYWCL
jgi:UDP-N-acetyl-D-galactosamine dehydrogenase